MAGLYFLGLLLKGKFAFLTALETWWGSLSSKTSYPNSTVLYLFKLLCQIWENKCVFCCAPILHLSLEDVGFRVATISDKKTCLLDYHFVLSMNYYSTVLGARKSRVAEYNREETWAYFPLLENILK